MKTLLHIPWNTEMQVVLSELNAAAFMDRIYRVIRISCFYIIRFIQISSGKWQQKIPHNPNSICIDFIPPSSQQVYHAFSVMISTWNLIDLQLFLHIHVCSMVVTLSLHLFQSQEPHSHWDGWFPCCLPKRLKNNKGALGSIIVCTVISFSFFFFFSVQSPIILL